MSPWLGSAVYSTHGRYQGLTPAGLALAGSVLTSQPVWVVARLLDQGQQAARGLAPCFVKFFRNSTQSFISCYKGRSERCDKDGVALSPAV